MANNDDLTIRIRADLGRTQAELARVQEELRRMGRSVRNVSQQATALDRVSTGFRNMGAAVLSAAAAFLAFGAAKDVMTDTIKTVAKFEVQIDKLGSISQASAKDLAKMEAEAKRLGTTSKYTATEVAEGMNFLAMAGFDANEILAATADVLDLASIGMMDLGEASDIASNVLTGFGLEAKEMTRVVDVMASTITSSNTNVQELGSAFSKVAPVATAMNVSLEETAAALGVLADAGIKAELAGTALKIVLTRLSTGTADKALQNLGVDAYDAQGQFKGLTKILQEMTPALSKMTEEAKNAALVEVFGKNALASGLTMLENLDKIEKKYKSNTEAGGKAAKMALEFSDNLDGAWNELKAAWEGVQLQFAKMSPMLEKLIDKTTKWLSSIKQGDIEPFISSIEKMGKVFGAVVTVMDKVHTAYTKISDHLLGGMKVALSVAIDGWSKLGTIFTEVTENLFTLGGVLETQEGKLIKVAQSVREFAGTSKDLEKLEKSITDLISENDKLIKQYAKGGSKDQIEAVKELTKQNEKLGEELGKLAVDKAYLKIAEGIKEATEATVKYTDETLQALNKTTQGRIDSTAKMVTELKAKESKLVNFIEAENQKLANTLQNLNNQRVQSVNSIESKIRAIKREGQAEYLQYADKQLEAEQNFAKAKEALTTGNYTLYKDYIQKAQALVTDSAGKEIKQNGKIMVSKQQTAKTAITGLKRVRDLEAQFFAQKEAETIAAHEATVAQKELELSAIQAQLEANKALIEALKTILELSTGKAIDLDTTALDAAIARVKALRVEISTVANAPLKIKTDDTEVKQAETKIKEVKKLVMNGISVEVDADTEPLDFGIKEIITTHDGDEITMGINPLYTKAQEELEKFRAGQENDPIVATVEVDTAKANKEIEEVRKPQIQITTIDIEDNEAKRAIQELQKPTFSTHTVNIKTTGGTAPAGFRGGGYTGSGADSDLAGFVHAGEFVVNAPATRALGAENLYRIMRNKSFDGYQDGGLVSNISTMNTASQTENNNVYNNSYSINASSLNSSELETMLINLIDRGM